MISIPRKPRKQLEFQFYHIIVQGQKKEYIFKEERFKNQYMKLIHKYIKETNLKVKAYCIMNNHAHFLFQVDKIEELSKFFHKLNTMYARYYNYMEKGRVGYVFRDRFLSEPITSHRYLIQCIKYIHFNPVKAKIVEKCEQYKFTSYHSFQKKLENKQNNDILSKKDYEDICSGKEYNINFLDIEIDQKEKITIAIQEFLEKYRKELYEVFFEIKVLEALVYYLKNEKNMKYTEIMEFFEITRGTMQRIILKNKKRQK